MAATKDRNTEAPMQHKGHEEGGRLLLRMEEAAEVLAVGRTTMYRLVSSGELPVVQVRGAVRIAYSSLQEFVNRKVKEGKDASQSKRPNSAVETVSTYEPVAD